MSGKAPALKEVVTWRLVPSGDSCLVVVVEVARTCIGTAWVAGAAARLREAGIPGVIDVVPAVATVGVHYRPEVQQALTRGSETPYHVAARAVAAVLDSFECGAAVGSRVVEIPVCYGGDHGPDLEAVAGACGLSIEALIDLHARADVGVQMIGFAPGHPYIGTFDARLAPPRRAQPRTAVPAGSIGLANRQSVIYPFVLPGGWNLIGRTPLKIFDPGRDPACLLQVGDRVRFVPISADEFQVLGAGQ